MTNRITPRGWPTAVFDPFGFSFRNRAITGSLDMSAVSLTGSATVVGSRTIGGSLDMSAVALTGSLTSSAQTTLALNGSLDMSAVALTGALNWTSGALPAWANVLLRANFDSSTNNLQGNVALSNPGTRLVRDTTTTKFGAGSYGVVIAAGTNGFEGMLTTPQWTFSSVPANSELTVEFWLRMTVGTDTTVNGYLDFDSAGLTSLFFLANSSTDDWGVAAYLNSQHLDDITGYTGSLATLGNDWHHIAAVREANGFERLYVDGVLRDSITNAELNAAAVDRLRFSSLTINNLDGNSNAPCGGGTFLIDDLRVSNVVVYTGSSFTPPTAALPTS